MRNNLYLESLVNHKSNTSHLISFFALAILTVIAFFPALDNNFVNWDDQFYITNNPFIINPTWTSLGSLTNKVVSLNYHPLTMISLWINAKVSGVDSATPFIATNLFVHVLNSILVYLLAFQLSDKKWIVALTTSLIFALHPMHVESVVWVSERKDVLYSFFLLLGLLSYDKYLKTSTLGFYLITLGLFILACLSKAMAVVMVPALMLIDILYKRNFKEIKLFLEKLPFVFIALIAGLVAMDVQAGGDFYGLLEHIESKTALSNDLGILDRINNASFANAYYLKQFLLTQDHSPFHPYSMMEAYNSTLSYLISIGSVIAFSWSAFRRKWDIVFGLGFYFSTILLVLQFIPVGSALVAERYTYLPYIGLAFIVGLGMDNVLQLGNKWIAAVLLIPIVMMLIQLTRVQSDVWKDHTTLFSQAVERYPDNAFSRKSLASGYWAEGELDSAMHHIEYAINSLGLATSTAFELLGNCYADKGNNQEALAFLNEAVELDSINITARYHRALQLIDIDPYKAIEDFNICEESGNAYVQSLIYAPRGRSHGLTANYKMALEDLNKAIELFPHDTNSYLDRAVTYELLGEKQKALLDYDLVMELDPSEQQAALRIDFLKSEL
jgi:tetratricopeptide (TPR) repeat protein